MYNIDSPLVRFPALSTRPSSFPRPFHRRVSSFLVSRALLSSVALVNFATNLVHLARIDALGRRAYTQKNAPRDTPLFRNQFFFLIVFPCYFTRSVRNPFSSRFQTSAHGPIRGSYGLFAYVITGR